MSTSERRALVDTNVRVYALQQSAVHHAPSRALLVQSGQLELCVTAQNLAEFFAIVTSSRRVTEPRTSAEAIDAIERLLAMPRMVLLPTPVDLVDRWMSLVRQQPISGPTIFDVQLIATMRASGVSTIYTYNVAHFSKFTGIDVLTP
jgi:toxin-antitoxin system PIN domain toxin